MENESILDSIKKVLGIQPNYDVFDLDILMHINSVFNILHQLGIGPDAGFAIQDEHDTWNTFLKDDPLLNTVKTYVYLRVKMIFDPPSTSFTQQAIKEQIQELEWRLSAHREGTLATQVILISDS